MALYVKVTKFGLQTGTDRMLYVEWSAVNAPFPTWLDKYKVEWRYTTGDGIWFVGATSDVDKDSTRQATWTAPANAITADVRIKPIKAETASGPTGDWTYSGNYNFKTPPTTPNTPTFEINYRTLKAEVDTSNIDDADQIHFQVVRDDTKVVNQNWPNINKTTNYCAYSWTIDIGHEYKVRCRSRNSKTGLYSEWSAYAASQQTIAGTPANITKMWTRSETEVYLEWQTISNATKYEVQYTTDQAHFDSSNDVQSLNVEAPIHHAEVTGLESGNTYYFRVRAANDVGNSKAWSKISSIIVGKAPSVPTTWSSTTTAVVGEPLTLYWIHNSEDGSNQKHAYLYLKVDNGAWQKIGVNPPTQSDDENLTSSYSINTSSYKEGAKIQWYVKTRGVLEGEKNYSPASVTRTVTIYAKPTVVLTGTDGSGADLANGRVTKFPLRLQAEAGPDTQTPLGYHIEILSRGIYETTNPDGTSKIVRYGDTVYSKFFDISTDLSVVIDAGDVDLENNALYAIRCTVTMNSGLTALYGITFRVAWTDAEYETIDALIIYNPDDLTMAISPYCKDSTGKLVSGVTMAVYRREFDGTFTEIATGLDNTKGQYVTDPHPALDYARYRIVATTTATGAVNYEDIPGVPINEKSMVIQWNEDWTVFDVDDNNFPADPTWAGSLVKLPYDIDISDDNNPDVTLIEYQGREHPVSYYGTHLGQSATWSTKIPKDDKDTLYALRRLVRWMGDVYVREPSGSGYWANIKVSFSQTHCDLTIPVTFKVTRVEGGT